MGGRLGGEAILEPMLEAPAGDSEQEKWLQEFLARNRDNLEQQKWLQDFVARNQEPTQHPLLERLNSALAPAAASVLGWFGARAPESSDASAERATWAAMPVSRRVQEINAATRPQQVRRPRGEAILESPMEPASASPDLRLQLAQARALVEPAERVRPPVRPFKKKSPAARPTRPPMDEAEAADAASLLRMFTARM